MSENFSLDVIWTSRFKKDYKKAMKRGFEIELLDEVIRTLSRQETLEEQYKDHSLTGNWKGYRECHIYPDWLLIYKIENGQLALVLSRTGTHSDLLE